MGHWKGRPPVIWNDETLALIPDQGFHIVDGGAAGDIFEPFDLISAHCRVYAFEPRGADAVTYPAAVCVDAGLWSGPERRVLHVARHPKASSIYPPNLEYLVRFPDQLGAPIRATAERVDVPLTSIDAEVSKGAIPKPNFIKLDVHSAEFEALIGSSNSLDDCLGLLVETWHVPIHVGQHLNGEVESWLQARGFQLYDTLQASKWPHGADMAVAPIERRQLVGSESLFLREAPPRRLWGHHLALLELFGYSTLAVQYCDKMLAGKLEHDATADQIQAVRAALLSNREMRLKTWNEETAEARNKVMQERQEAKREAKQALREERLAAKQALREERLELWRLERQKLKRERQEAKKKPQAPSNQRAPTKE